MCLALAGAVISGIGAVMGLQRQAASEQAQGDIHKRQAALEREKGGFEGARMVERGRQIIGQQVAAFGANNLTLTGSVRDVIEGTGRDIALDIAAKRYGTNIAAENETMLSRVRYRNAQDINASVPFAFLAPVIQGVGTTLRGAF